MLRSLIALCLLLGVAVLTQACSAHAPNRAADVKRNERLLADAPPFPAARVAGTASSRERDPETGQLDDHYTTVRVERFNARIPLRQAQAWYRHHLKRHGWRVRTFWEERVAGNVPPGVDTIGRRGKALVEVSLTPSGGAVEAQVLADFLGNRLCQSQSDPGCW